LAISCSPSASNSDGPLVNLRGQLIGLNTAILSPGGGNIGIGFAVPINMARRVMEQLVQNGEVRRGRIGVVMRDVGDRAQAEEAAPEGAMIAEVVANSPAAQAGIQKGDVIVAVDGKAIHSATQLRNSIGLTPVGQQLRITLDRGGIDHTVSVEVAPANDNTGTVPAAHRR
jgi:serine protease Do